MRRLPVFLAFLLILTACAAPPAPTATPAQVSQPQLDAPILDGTFETSLLVTEWRGGSEGNVIFPLDPASGAALRGYTPISLGNSSNHSFSPDRQILAVVSFPNPSSYRGSLFLIDLPGWKTRDLGLELSGWVHSMVFSRDGRQLAIVHGESRFKLTMVNLEEGTIMAESQTVSYVSRLKFTEDGQGLMLYSPRIASENGLTAGPPQVLLLNAGDLTPRWSAELEGVHDGIFAKDETVTSATIHEPGMALYISPGLAFAPDRDALYIVHADSEQLTTVDFESQRVKTVEVQPKLTWFERLLSMTADTAYAKIGAGITRQAAVSPDGQFLYVAGVNNTTVQDERGNWQMEQTPLGLEILQTGDGSRLDHIEAETTELSISPDGRFLYLRHWGSPEDNIPWTEIFDTASGELLTRKIGISGMPAWLMNGKYLLVSTYSTAESSHHMSILEPDGSRVLTEWTDSTYIWWMTTP
jgi:DNA-binding beta-propeller fold protein YncE